MNNIFISDAINWDWKPNQGLLSRWSLLPGQGRGLIWRDLVRKNKFVDFSVSSSKITNGFDFPNGGIRFDGNTSFYEINLGSLLKSVSCTLLAWVQPKALGFQAGVISCNSDFGAPTAGIDFGSHNIGGNVWHSNMINAWGGSPEVNKWQMIAITNDGTTGRLYQNGVQIGSGSSTSFSTYTSNVILGVSQTYYYCDAILDNICIYDRPLSSIELIQLWIDSKQKYRNTYNWRKYKTYSLPPVGGTTYQENLSDSVTTSSAIIKQPQKIVSDSTSFSSSILKSTSRILTSSITLTSSLAKSTLRLLSDSISFSDSLIKICLKPFTDSINQSDSLVKQAYKTLTDTITNTSAIIKSTARSLTDSITLSSDFAKIKALLRSLSDSITLSESTIVRQTKKTLTDSVTLSSNILKYIGRLFSSSLTLSSSLVKKGIKGFTDTITLSDNWAYEVLTDIFYLNLSDSVSFSDTIVKQCNKTFNATQNLSSSLIKQISRTLSDSFGFSSSLTKTFLKSLTDSIGLSGVLLRRGQKVCLDTISVSSNVSKSLSRLLSDTVNFSPNFVKNVQKLLDDEITLSDNLDVSRVIIILLASTIVLSESLQKVTQKSFNVSLNIGSSLVKSIQRALTAVLSFVGILDLLYGSGDSPVISSVVNFTYEKNNQIDFKYTITSNNDFAEL